MVCCIYKLCGSLATIQNVTFGVMSHWRTAKTIKGLGYSAEAYEAGKARLDRKYGGSRRQVQSHLNELKKLKTIEENNP